MQPKRPRTSKGKKQHTAAGGKAAMKQHTAAGGKAAKKQQTAAGSKVPHMDQVGVVECLSVGPNCEHRHRLSRAVV
jgi:hypothetical protein